jgi:hypothetical protein
MVGWHFVSHIMLHGHHDLVCASKALIVMRPSSEL